MMLRASDRLHESASRRLIGTETSIDACDPAAEVDDLSVGQSTASAPPFGVERDRRVVEIRGLYAS